MNKTPSSTNTKKIIFLNTFYQFFAKAISLIFVFLSTLLLRRYLGRSGYGDYIFIFSYVTIFSILADFGTRLTSISYANKRKEEENKRLGIALALRFLLLIFAFNIYLITALLLPIKTTLKLPLVLASLLLFVFSFRDSFYMIFTSKLKLQFQSLVELGVGFLIMIAVALTVFLKFNISFLYFLMGLLPLTFLIFFMRKTNIDKKISLSLPQKETSFLLKKSSLVFGSLFLFTLSAQLPQILLKMLHSSSALGIFGLSYKVYENALLPAALFMNTCLPLISRFKKDELQKAKQFLQNTFDVILILSFLVAAAMFLLAPLGVRIITGNFLLAEIKTIRILSLALIASYLNHFFGFVFLGKSLNKDLFLSKIFGFVIALIFVWPLLKNFSYLGAASLTLLIEVSVLLYSLYLFYKRSAFLPLVNRFPKTFLKIIKTKGSVLIR